MSPAALPSQGLADPLVLVGCESPQPSNPPVPTLTTLRPFQWLSVEHHVGQGHLGLRWGLCGGEAEGQARRRPAAAPSVQS